MVRSGRSRFQKDPAALDRLATGQIYTAEQAKQNGLVDKIGFIEEAVDRAISLAGLDQKTSRWSSTSRNQACVPCSWGAKPAPRPAVEIQVLREMTTPRAYYLCTWLPGMEGIKE